MSPRTSTPSTRTPNWTAMADWASHHCSTRSAILTAQADVDGNRLFSLIKAYIL